MTTPIILAGGLGTRMKSAVPKVLHQVGGQSMISRIVDVAHQATAMVPLVVYSPATMTVRDALADRATFVLQPEPRGTGDAIRWALEALSSSVDEAVVLYGDTPLIQAGTIRELIQERTCHNAVLSLAAFHLSHPAGYGRLLQDQTGALTRIVEEKDATPEERRCTLVNAGLYCFDVGWLRGAIRELRPSVYTGELYLSDFVAIAHEKGEKIQPLIASDAQEFQGVNTPEQLAQAEAYLRVRRIDRG